MSRAAAVVEVLARALADEPESVSVVESEHRGTTVVELYMEPGDLGRVIGRQRRTEAALRTLAAAAADVEGIKVQLELREKGGNRR